MANGRVRGDVPNRLHLTSLIRQLVMVRTVSLSCLAAATGALLGAAPAARAQSMLDQAIYSRCSAAMASDFQQAGKTPEPGLIDSTCNCVVQQINTTHNIDLARTICSKQAMTQAGS
jgi:hypothetical protein